MNQTPHKKKKKNNERIEYKSRVRVRTNTDNK